MFRDDAQAARALSAALCAAGLPEVWSEAGPTARAEALRQGPGGATRGQRLVLQVAWALWERRIPPPLAFGELRSEVDRVAAAALFSLVTASMNGPEAVDAWLASLPPHICRSPARASTAAWIEELAADWPTVDLLSLRYARAVIERQEGDLARAAQVLDVHGRTLSRMLAAASKGRVHSLHTRAGGRAPRARPPRSGDDRAGDEGGAER